MSMSGNASETSSPGLMDPQRENAPAPSETSSPSAETPRKAKSDAEAAAEVAALLRGDAPPEATGEPQADAEGVEGAEPPESGEGPQEAAQEATGEQGRPETFEEAAKMLGFKPKELYDLPVNTGDGETVTVGELKDAYQVRKPIEQAARENVERAVQLDERESVLTDKQTVWDELGDELNKVLPPQAQKKMFDHMVERLQHEDKLLKRAIPELQDPQTFKAFIGDVRDALGKYGYAEHELSIRDHRQLVIMRDFMRMKKRLDDLAKYKPTHTPPKQQARGRGPAPDKKQQALQRAQRGSEADKLAAVSALIQRK